MKFSSINLNNIKVINKENNFLDIKYNSGKLEFETPEMYLPFGLESNYGNHYLKLQFRKNKDDIVEFYNFIEILEDKLKELLGTQNVPSQIKTSEKYDPLLVTKLIKVKDNLVIDVYKDSENINIYKLPKKIYVKAKVFLDNIWKKGDTYYYKIKVKEINITS
jgi:hypothetical protein